ncbi:hypothetical protein [Amycolatopsis vancoresmycina]|uniref:Uncharacterized protein n=1 Tax=Amycolatopsis vancoresmycina DSM 44592 TaxID=1292037 RepID=R1G9Q5_9PSEU|nr:hypothetical protein [Amycolatopsis vancoresmycina]EOD68093.1 hypothetical protein H480_13154 [Amycolatopsis vancoresmycina DSM 44592]
MTWWVVVEEQRTSERIWSLSERFSHPDRETAEAEALRLAREYEPAYPWSPKSRTVLRGPGGYLVIVEGRTSTYHFRLNVLEEL